MKTRRALQTCLLATTAAACGGAPADPPVKGPPSMQVVGTAGGAVTSSDGTLELVVPPDALTGDVTVTISPVEAPGQGALGSVFEIGPTGTKFATPVALTLHYQPGALGGTPESSLRVATFAAGAWQILPGAIVDTQAHTVSGLTTHLSPYGIVGASTGKTCANFETYASSYPADGPEVCNNPNPSTCAGEPDTCAFLPGSTRDTCTDNPCGYTATCCLAPGAPVCVGVEGHAACNLAGTCGAPPTCDGAASTACADLPGATLQGCTDQTDGYRATCCFPPQAPVCIVDYAPQPCTATYCLPGAGCADGNPCGNYPGGTVRSCTDGPNGFTATCCFLSGTLPMSLR